MADAFAARSASAAGLASDEAVKRLLTHGPNRLDERRSSGLAVDLLKRFRNPLTIVLLGAAAVAAATGDPTSFFIITTIVLFSVVLDFVQERRAENAADKLRR